MAEFMIRFFICNIFISMVIGILVLAKRLLKNSLTSRTHYNLWFLLLGLLAVPFLPIKPGRMLQIFETLFGLQHITSSAVKTTLKETALQNHPNTGNWMNDISRSVSQKTPSAIGMFLFLIWAVGMFLMVLWIVKAMFHFHTIKKSALPLQNPAVHRLYQDCLKETGQTKSIPIYSTAFLKSPVIAGIFQPCIYLPIHLISDYQANDVRYMLLHELGHYKYKDTLAIFFMNLAGVFYWFNPFVWYSLKEMKHDREIACDTFVLQLLDETDYKDYGTTLIHFAQKISFTPFPFATGISGNMKQLQKRVKNIAAYHPASFRKKFRSTLVYLLTACLLFLTAPLFSIHAAESDKYSFDETNRKITYIDLSNLFQNYNGSFVLYDTAEDSWQIYNKENALKRISPASTFKIYSALFGLESQVITPEHSQIAWDGQKHMYDSWNCDQTLESAMQNSVTWYFQSLDKKTGLSTIREYVLEIGYGSQRIEGSTSSYWINSPLKISPVEQVKLLKKLYYNELNFSPENVKTVKDSIRLISTDKGVISGKTGTEEIKGENTSGWFIGYIEQDGRTYFFATNIQSKTNASGSLATELTFSILSDFGLWDTDSYQLKSPDTI